MTGDLDFLDYGWRMYDDGLGKWFGMDLLAEKHYNVNPYMYCVGNPVNKFDPNGQDWYIFNQSDGMFQQKVNFKGTHRLVIHSKEKLKGGLEYDSYTFLDFADPIEDPMNIDGGNINQVIFVSEEEMISMLEEQGAFDVSWFKFAWESQGGGKFDYSYKVLPFKYEQATLNPNKNPSSALFLPEGDYTAHNQMNFGNYLWGATGYAVGFEFGTLKLGAHLNSLVNSKRNGYRSQLDSDDDQRSIIKGAYHAYKMNYRNRRK